MSPWGKVAKGGKTRAKFKSSNRLIIVQRNGLPMKNK
jgi:ribosomal protein L2